MAYNEKPTNVYPPNPLPDTFIKGQEIDRQIRQSINASNVIHHDYETVVVNKIILNEPFSRGVIEGTFTKNGKSVSNVKPLSPNQITVPVEGEKVFVTEIDGDFYYTDILNSKGIPNENSTGQVGDVTFSGDFKRKNQNAVAIEPGCILFEGRTGQSICFSQTTEQKPIIHIRTNDSEDAIIEKPNLEKDDSSIYLTSDGIEGMTFDGEEVKGKNVIIQSDNILINGRKKVRISSSKKRDIEITAGKGIILNPGEKQTIKMGDPKAPMLPTVNGQKLLEFQTSILGILTGINNILVSISAGPAALVKIANDARKLVNDVTTVKDSILKLEFLNFEVMTADPNFKIPERPKIPEVPEIPKTDFKVPELPEIPSTPDIKKLSVEDQLKNLKQ